MESSHSANNINKYKKIDIINNTQPNYKINSVSNNDIKKITRNRQNLKPSISSININRNDKKKININDHFGKDQNIMLKEIPIIKKERNKNIIEEDNINLGDSKIITPKKRYIFNRVNPIKLLGAFKKELTIFSKKEQILKVNGYKQ